MHSTSYPLYTLHLKLSFQCDLHFPRIHYQAVAICMAFIPQVAPHMEIAHYSPSENIAVEFCSTNHQLLCYLVITSLFYVWNHSTMGLQIEKANYLTNVHLLSWGGHDFFFLLCFSPAFFLCHPLLGDRKRLERRKSFFGYLFMDFPFNIHAFFRTIWVQRRICCLGGGQGQKSGFSSNEPSGWREEREREREGTRERGFMCSLVNERQALKVTGCVYYWSVSRLMGRGEEKREERAELLSRDQSTQAWEQEGAPSNKLRHTRCACPYRFSDDSPACWMAFTGN